MKRLNKYIIIGNPVAGGGTLNKIAQAESLIKAKGLEVEVRLTTRPGDAELFAKEASQLKDTIVIAAGGDGTYNEVANGLAGSSTPMAILPVGTTSVLAKEIGVPFSTPAAVEIACNGRIERINLGRITYLDAQGQPVKAARYFLLMIGFGFDGDSVYGVNVRLKKIWGQLAYILSGIHVVLSYRPQELTATSVIKGEAEIEGGRFRRHPDYTAISGDKLNARSYIAVVSNAASYGGNFSLSPDASLSSPDLCVFLHHCGTRIKLLHMLWAIVTGRALELRNISYFRTEKLSVSGPVNIQIDGDYAGRYSAEIESVKSGLNLVMPL